MVLKVLNSSSNGYRRQRVGVPFLRAEPLPPDIDRWLRVEGNSPEELDEVLARNRHEVFNHAIAIAEQGGLTDKFKCFTAEQMSVRTLSNPDRQALGSVPMGGKGRLWNQIMSIKPPRVMY